MEFRRAPPRAHPGSWRHAVEPAHSHGEVPSPVRRRGAPVPDIEGRSAGGAKTLLRRDDARTVSKPLHGKRGSGMQNSASSFPPRALDDLEDLSSTVRKRYYLTLRFHSSALPLLRGLPPCGRSRDEGGPLRQVRTPSRERGRHWLGRRGAWQPDASHRSQAAEGRRRTLPLEAEERRAPLRARSRMARISASLAVQPVGL